MDNKEELMQELQAELKKLKYRIDNLAAQVRAIDSESRRTEYGKILE